MRTIRWSVLWVGVLAGCQVHGMSAGSTTPSGSSLATSSGGDASRPSPDQGGGADSGGALEAGMVRIPDVSGKTRADAEAMLRAAGVRGTIDSGDPDTDFTKQRACGTVPGAGATTRATLAVEVSFCEPMSADQQARHDLEDKQGRQREQHVQLVGLTADRAKQTALDAGWTGEVRVMAADVGSACQVDRVCSVDPSQWETRIGSAMPLMLHIGRKTEIKMPD